MTISKFPADTGVWLNKQCSCVRVVFFSKHNVTVEEICITGDRLCQPEHICSHSIT